MLAKSGHKDAKTLEERRPLSATGAVGDKRKTEPVESILEPGSKSLGQTATSKKLADDSDGLNQTEVSYYTYTHPSKSATISQQNTTLYHHKKVRPMMSYYTFKEQGPHNTDKSQGLHLSMSDSDELYSFTQSGSSDELAELSSEPKPFTDDISYTEPEGFDPVIAFCTECNQRVITTVSTERKKKAYTAFIVLLVLLLWPFCIIPLLLKRCKVAVHYCSICGSNLTHSASEKTTTKCTEKSRDTQIKVSNESDSKSLEDQLKTHEKGIEKTQDK